MQNNIDWTPKFPFSLTDFKLKASENLKLELYIKKDTMRRDLVFIYVSKQTNKQTDIHACTRNDPSRLSVCVHLYPRWLMYHPSSFILHHNQPGDPFYVEWSFVWAVLV